ncbi:ADP-ribose pyrophosphatase [Nitrobacteraceae bacterium AZCC 2146]
MSDEMGSPEGSLARYRALLIDRPDCFRDPADSPVAILTADRDIAAAQSEEAARRTAQNLPFPDVRVGVLASDPYLGMLARDAVRFADGSLGVYNRHIGEAGCVIMPIITGSIVLIRIFRHATRDWAWEFPGGRVSPGEDPAVTARHELEEEIGAIDPVMQALGSVHPYPAFSSACIHLFTATIDQIGGPQTAEGIISVETVSPARLFEMVDNGDISDASAIACILKAKLRGHI